MSHRERAFLHRARPYVVQKRVCELEEKQWRTDRNEFGSTPCLIANCGELNTECTGDGGASAGVPRRAAMTGDRNTASSGSLHEYVVNESHTGNVPFYTRPVALPSICLGRTRGLCAYEKGGACFNEFGPFSLPAADLVPISHRFRCRQHFAVICCTFPQ